eukprot:gene17591-23921_t
MKKAVEAIATSTDPGLTTLAQQLMEELSVLALDCVNDMDAPALCSLLGALIEAGGTPNPSLVHKILQHTEAKLHSFDSYDNLQVLWAMAYLGVDRHSELMHELLSAGTSEPDDLLRLESDVAALKLHERFPQALLVLSISKLDLEAFTCTSWWLLHSDLGL